MAGGANKPCLRERNMNVQIQRICTAKQKPSRCEAKSAMKIPIANLIGQGSGGV